MNPLIDDLRIIIEDDDKALAVYFFLKEKKLFDETAVSEFIIKRKMELCPHIYPDGKTAMLYIAGAGTCQLCGWDDF